MVASSSSGKTGAPRRLGRARRRGNQPSRHTIRIERLPQSIWVFMMPSMLTMPVPSPNAQAPEAPIARWATIASVGAGGRPGSPAATIATAT